MDSSSTNTAGLVLNSNGECELNLEKLKQNVGRILQTWESLIQGIRDVTDLARLNRIFRQDKRSFNEEFNNKKQCLTKYIFQIDAELEENTKRLENLQKQYFAKNEEKQLAITQQTHKLQMFRVERTNIEHAEIKLQKIREQFFQKSWEATGRLRNYFNVPQQYNIQSQGLSKETIQTFHLFTADASLVGDQCRICMEEIDLGRRMRRLTCDGQHYFCQQCIERWFAKHNTCPLCRHKFE